MKTAISIPDPIFQAAENMAKRLGISRSELFTKAMSEFMIVHKHENITDSLNKIYSHEQENIDPELISMQMKSIQKEEW